MLWVGVDVGGTFTDGVTYDDEAKTFRYEKTPSTPDDPVHAVGNVIRLLNIGFGSISRFAHGITIGTNAVLEKKGAEVWMLTTRGFRDVLEIGRTNRHELYDIRTQRIAPLLPRTRVIEVDERMLANGSALVPLDEDGLRRSISEQLGGLAPSSLIVCFLHSYANPAHEERALEIAASMLPGWYICASSEVLPQYREYERFSTAALNAYVGPITAGYLNRLEASMAGEGFGATVYIMTSNGGVATAARAKRLPVSTILSGPAGGVAAAVDLGRRLGIRTLITCDMGGTSTDVCLIEELQPGVTNQQSIGGHVNRSPQTAINAVGAGGGSIAWIDLGDQLRVGPQSAGALPGPACYGRGGTAPTITDANLVLNRLSGDTRLGGQLRLDKRLAADAIEALRSVLPTLDVHALAEGVIQIAVARMVGAIKEISIAEGHDPRDFTLLAFGGAGPMHGCAIADELEIKQVLVPVGPGNFCALGSLISDLRRDYSLTRSLQTDQIDIALVDATFVDLEARARLDLLGEGVADGDVSFVRSLGMRYLGQSWELDVRLAPNTNSIEALDARFGEVHDKRFGHRAGGRTEIVEFRIVALGGVPKPIIGNPLQHADHTAPVSRDVYFDGTFVSTAVVARNALAVEFSGPMIVEEPGSTTVVPPHWRGLVYPSGELLLTRGQAS